MIYKVEIKEWGGNFPDWYNHPNDVIFVLRKDNQDMAVRFLCACDTHTPIYIPFGKYNMEEGNSQERKLIWDEQDKVLSLVPSIKVKSNCNCHFYITKNERI